MQPPDPSPIRLQISLIDTDPTNAPPAGFAEAVRTELARPGFSHVEEVPPEPEPSGAKFGGELLIVAAFLINVGDYYGKIESLVRGLRQLQATAMKTHRRLRVRLAGEEIDLANQSAEQIAARVRSRLRAAPSGKRKALIVANSRYQDSRLAQLRAPSKDAEGLSRVLGDPAIGGFDIELLKDADETVIRRRIDDFFSDRGHDDLLLLHFSGHGVKDQHGQLHLAARDTDMRRLGSTAVPTKFVRDCMDASSSQRIVLILDCCYSGAFPEGARARSGTDVSLADAFGTGRGHVVLTASSATEYAFEGDSLTQNAGQPSFFTGALVEGLESGDADLDSDGSIGVDEMYEYVHRAVRHKTTAQVPTKSGRAEGEMVIARSNRVSHLPERLLADLNSVHPSVRVEAVAELRRLKDGTHAGWSGAAAEELVRLRDTDDSLSVRSAAAETLGGPLTAHHPPTPYPLMYSPPPQAPAPTTGGERPAGLGAAEATAVKAAGWILVAAAICLVFLSCISAPFVAEDATNYTYVQVVGAFGVVLFFPFLIAGVLLVGVPRSRGWQVVGLVGLILLGLYSLLWVGVGLPHFLIGGLPSLVACAYGTVVLARRSVVRPWPKRPRALAP